MWNMSHFYANDQFCAAPCKTMDAKAAAEEDSLQIVKIVMIYFFTALSIEEHNRVPPLVDQVLMIRCFQNGRD
jgi:hypothetical protein